MDMYLLVTVEKTKIKKKRPGMAHFKSRETCKINQTDTCSWVCGNQIEIEML